MSEFCDNLKKLREQANLTRKELAARCNISAFTIGQYERGERLPDVPKILAIAEALHLPSLDPLFGYHPNDFTAAARAVSSVLPVNVQAVSGRVSITPINDTCKRWAGLPPLEQAAFIRAVQAATSEFNSTIRAAVLPRILGKALDSLYLDTLHAMIRRDDEAGINTLSLQRKLYRLGEDSPYIISLFKDPDRPKGNKKAAASDGNGSRKKE